MREFRPGDHSYWMDGIRVPSATQILKLCGLIDSTYYTEESRQRGQAVHAACHYIAEGDLDVNSVHHPIKGYVDAYVDFAKTVRWLPTVCETPIFSEQYRFGTTPDQVIQSTFEICELKSGTMMPWTALQTALQAIALFPKGYYKSRRFGVELHKDGTFRKELFKNVNDFTVAINCIGVAYWRIQQGENY